MDKTMEILPHLSAYQPALLALALLCMSVLAQSFVLGPFEFAKGEQSPGMPLKGDHSLFSFRAIRTHMNSVENLPAFAVTVLLAILLDVDVAVVNWLAVIHLVLRLVFCVTYYSGVGKVAGGPRTLSYVGGWLSNVVLSGYVIAALI